MYENKLLFFHECFKILFLLALLQKLLVGLKVDVSRAVSSISKMLFADKLPRLYLFSRSIPDNHMAPSTSASLSVRDGDGLTEQTGHQCLHHEGKCYCLGTYLPSHPGPPPMLPAPFAYRTAKINRCSVMEVYIDPVR